MKYIIFSFMMSFSLTLNAETPEQILNYFRKKNVEKIVSCSSYPFGIDIGDDADDPNITNSKVLTSKLNQLYNRGIFNEAIKGKLKKMGAEQYGLEILSYNKSGELESESAYIFTFKKNTKGYTLCRIWVAG